MGNNIVVVGTTFVDIKGFPFNKYIPAGRNAGKVEIVHGGVGRNVAEDIANLELRPTYVSMADTTPEGADVVSKLKKHKVNTEFIPQVEDGMGIWLAVFNERGDVAGAISKRPEMGPLAKLLEERGDEIFSDCDSVVIEVDMEKEVVRQVFKFAEKYHKRVYALVANMSIAVERRDFIKRTDCFICNEQEAGILFLEDFAALPPKDCAKLLGECVRSAEIPSMVVTLGEKGAVYADRNGNSGWFPAISVQVVDTTGAGDAFCAGVASGLTYGKTLREAVAIGTKLAASVITVRENVCSRFLPAELGIDPDAFRTSSTRHFFGTDEDLQK